MELNTYTVALNRLKHEADRVAYRDGGASQRLLCHSDFLFWPASMTKHHTWPGGLVEHTAQVLDIALDIAVTAGRAGKPLDRDVIKCAAIFHDFGKIDDYEKIEEIDRKVAWKKSELFDLVHHVVRSAELWMEYTVGVEYEFRLMVKHAILAHHGCKEWGSPVTPRTREAWAVHLADMSSVNCIEDRWTRV